VKRRKQYAIFFKCEGVGSAKDIKFGEVEIEENRCNIISE